MQIPQVNTSKIHARTYSQKSPDGEAKKCNERDNTNDFSRIKKLKKKETLINRNKLGDWMIGL